MPRYATIDDLNARLKDAQIQLTNTSVPTSTQAENILDQIEGEAHAYLRNRYPLPITDPEARLTLRGIIVSLACERIFALAYPQTELNPFREEARAARELLRMLARGEANLPRTDAPTPLPITDMPTDEPEFKRNRRL
jgi:phage gp36-like protein